MRFIDCHDLPARWEHPGVTQQQRRDLAREVFDEIRLRDGKLVAVKPQPEYAPLFAYSIWNEGQNVGDERSPWVEQSSPTYILGESIFCIPANSYWSARV